MAQYLVSKAIFLFPPGRQPVWPDWQVLLIEAKQGVSAKVFIHESFVVNWGENEHFHSFVRTNIFIHESNLFFCSEWCQKKNFKILFLLFEQNKTYTSRYTAPPEQGIIKKWRESIFSTLKKYYHFLAKIQTLPRF